MGSSTKQYNLEWSEFDSSLKSAVKGLRSRGDLVDVTLVAGGKTFPAHKIVLSAASTLFLELLKVTPCQHPVILLAGIGATDLEFLLEFVYSGEVRVHPTQLSSLLQAAHILNIRGLAQGSITAEKPDDQDLAEAAMAASSASNQEINVSSLGGATRSDLIATVNLGGRSLQKRKSNWKDLENCNVPHDKWAKYDSDEESSEAESFSKDVDSSSLTVNQTTQQGTSKQTSNSASAISSCPTSGVKGDQGSVPLSGVSSKVSSKADLSRSATSEIREPFIPPHCLELNEDEENKEDSYAAIAAAADAAALVASTLADKKGISEQPAACPLCNAIIRQSRNLRRHLELKHFGKRPKKGKGAKRKSLSSQCDTDTESNAGSVADTAVIEHVQVEMKSPSVCGALPSSSSSSTHPSHKHHTLTELQPAHQHQNVDSYLQQQQQLQIESFSHVTSPSSSSVYQIPYPHPHPHLAILRGNPHTSLLAGDSIAFRTASQQQFSSVYSDSSRSVNHQDRKSVV